MRKSFIFMCAMLLFGNMFASAVHADDELDDKSRQSIVLSEDSGLTEEEQLELILSFPTDIEYVDDSQLLSTDEFEGDEKTHCRYRGEDYLVTLDKDGGEEVQLRRNQPEGCYTWHSGNTVCSGGTLYEWVCWTGSWYCGLNNPGCFYMAIGCC